jgi:hypothetical protein
MDAIRSVDKLGSDANTTARLAEAAFEDVSHAELPSNLLRVNLPASVGKARAARDHHDAVDARQGDDDILGDTVRQIAMFRIAALAEKWQHGN